jgi:alcohol dehydrogenase (cytochrome c)
MLRGVVATVAFAAVLFAPTSAAGDWTMPNGTIASTRHAAAASITPSNVGQLAPRWRYRIRGKGTDFGTLTSTPVVAGDTVYLQTWKSDIVALDRRTGTVRWARLTTAPNDGPNGVAVHGRRIFAATDTTAFSLDARTGRRLWSRRLVNRFEQFVNIAPVVDRGRAYFATVGLPPGGRGAVYALDAETGRRLWRFATVPRPWANPRVGGGGAWNPVSVDPAGRVYVGIANPAPWGGSRASPNGAWFGASTLFTDSLVVLDGRSGRLLWFDQVTPRDVRDYDFHLSPLLVSPPGQSRRLVIGAGKAGRVIAWDRQTHRRVWETAVGVHRNDRGPLPPTPTLVCPGLFGGVLTPMAYAAGTVFVPVVDLCMRESAVTTASVLQRPASEGTGSVWALDAATGAVRWVERVPAPLFGCATVAGGVVFAPSFDGTVHAFAARNGRPLWRARLRAGINSCPAVAGGLLLVGAGAPLPDGRPGVSELVAFGVAG